MNNITKKNNNLILSFNYNPVIISIIKNFESRKYDVKTREWSVPIVHIIDVLDILMPFKFQPSKEVNEEYDKAIRKKAKIQKILEGDFNKAEIKLIKKTKLPLFDFQKIGAGFLCTTGSSLLGDEPGTGKSITSLATILINKSRKNLIVCPNSLKRNWEDEINKWIPSAKIFVVSGTKKQRDEIYKKAQKISRTFFLIINYELLLYDIEELKKF